jgi:hypothetical protein
MAYAKIAELAASSVLAMHDPSASSSLISWLRKNVVASFQLANRRIEALRQARSLSPRFRLEYALVRSHSLLSLRHHWRTVGGKSHLPSRDRFPSQRLWPSCRP